MREIYGNFGFIVGFMFIVYLFELFLGDKMAQSFCLVVLLSMLLTNTKEFKNTMDKVQDSWGGDAPKKVVSPGSKTGAKTIVGVGLS